MITELLLEWPREEEFQSGNGIFLLTCLCMTSVFIFAVIQWKWITADHERRNWIEQHSKQYPYLIQRFYSKLLTVHLTCEWWGARREDCIHVQRYNENSNAWHNGQPEMYTVQSRLHEVLLYNRVFNPCLMTTGHLYAKENNEKKLVFTSLKTIEAFRWQATKHDCNYVKIQKPCTGVKPE